VGIRSNSREVSGESAPLAGARPPMRRHEGVVLIQLDPDVGRADPERWPMRPGGGPGGPGEEDMAVRVELGPLPLGDPGLEAAATLAGRSGPPGSLAVTGRR
jgi:hypothetical protein